MWRREGNENFPQYDKFLLKLWEPQNDYDENVNLIAERH